jgi:antitoxin HicB
MQKNHATSDAVPSGYAVTLEQAGDAVLVSCPDIPEVHAVVYAPHLAGEEALDAIETALYGYMQDRRRIPPAKASVRRRLMIYLPTLTKAKLALYGAVLDQCLSKAELARRLGLPRPSVDRLLDVRHDSRMAQLDTALALLGHRLELQVREAA